MRLTIADVQVHVWNSKSKLAWFQNYSLMKHYSSLLLRHNGHVMLVQNHVHHRGSNDQFSITWKSWYRRIRRHEATRCTKAMARWVQKQFSEAVWDTDCHQKNLRKLLSFGGGNLHFHPTVFSVLADIVLQLVGRILLASISKWSAWFLSSPSWPVP